MAARGRSAVVVLATALIVAPSLAASPVAGPVAGPVASPAPRHGAGSDMGRPVYTNVTGPAGLGGFVHAGFLGDPPHLEADQLEYTSAGGCWLDMDTDGWLDLYLVNSLFITFPERNALLDPHGTLYRNLRNGTFADVSAGSGADLRGIYMGCAAADYDDDGRPDLFVAGFNGSALLHNLGGGRFEDVAASAGVADKRCGDEGDPCWAVSASWLDHDRDGCLDLFVDHFRGPPREGSGGQVNALYRSRCDGTFEEVHARAGLREASQSWSSVAADLDNDGWPDLYVSNDGQENDLYINNRDATFRRVSTVADNGGRNAMGTAAGDFDHDGFLDLVTTNFVSQHNGVFRHEGTDYVDIGDQEPFADSYPFSGWAAKWFDLNNDGFQDLMVLNSMPTDLEHEGAEQNLLAYENLDGTRFAQVLDDLGRDLGERLVARSGPWGDYDNDGDVDLVVTEAGENPVHLFRADQTGGNFLLIDLVGTASRVTRDAVGARVRVSAPGLPEQVQEKMLGTGLLGSDDPRLHFGLAAKDVATVEVAWPDGSTQTFSNVRANSIVRLTQDTTFVRHLRDLPLVRVEGPSVGQRLQPLAFHADAAAGWPGQIASYHWDFGDATASGQDATHAFRDVGAFFVKATATDTLGRAKTWQHRVSITARVQANVTFEAPQFLPHQPIRGHVDVHFEDGTPVRRADVRLVVQYSSGNRGADALAAGLPRFMRDVLGYQTLYANVTTDWQGRAEFTLPFLQEPAATPGRGLNNPGSYLFTVTGGVRGSVLEPARATATVVAALPDP